MNAIPNNLQVVHARIVEAARMAGRKPASILLLAVSKTRPALDVLEAIQCGQRAFGENYVQEGIGKIEAVRRLLPPGDTPPIWHFIGPLQGNKTRQVAENFDWVHSIDRLKIAERLSAQRPSTLPPLEVCVQVNISGEESKSGVSPAEAGTLCRAVAALPRLRLRGLMAIPAPAENEEEARRPFARLRHLLEALQTEGLPLDVLSMGMSHDLAAAIHEGATLVRVGTAIFGEREKQ